MLNVGTNDFDINSEAIPLSTPDSVLGERDIRRMNCDTQESEAESGPTDLKRPLWEPTTD